MAVMVTFTKWGIPGCKLLDVSYRIQSLIGLEMFLEVGPFYI